MISRIRFRTYYLKESQRKITKLGSIVYPILQLKGQSTLKRKNINNNNNHLK